MNNDFIITSNNSEVKKDDRNRRNIAYNSFEDFSYNHHSIYYEPSIPYQGSIVNPRSLNKPSGDSIDYHKGEFTTKANPDFEFSESLFEPGDPHIIMDGGSSNLNELKNMHSHAEQIKDRTISMKTGKHVMFNPQIVNHFTKEDAIYRAYSLPQSVEMQNPPYQNHVSSNMHSGGHERKSKANVKNTYIKKINSLINIPKSGDETNSHGGNSNMNSNNNINVTNNISSKKNNNKKKNNY